MTTQKTLIIDDAIPYAKQIFSHLGKVITLPGKSIDAESVKNADALIVRSRTQVNEVLLKNSSIQFVGSTVVGLDHIDQDYLQQQGIHFYSAQGCNSNSVAEYVITALFDLAENHSFELSSKTLGIIGVGHVGKLVQQKAKALGITCLLNDPLRQRNETNSDESFVDLDTCLQADIITFHTPLTKSGNDATFNLLSAEKLAKIDPNQIIVNAARGGIIDEQAWSQTKTKANIIDCWVNEPNISEKLYNTAYLATPHIAGHSLDAKVAGSEMVYQDLCQLWQTPAQNDWQKELPKAPETIKVVEEGTIQNTLSQLFNQTHNIHNDDQAIRDPSMSEVHNKYEYFRRNFPIYREWKNHTVSRPQNEKLFKELQLLNFNIS